MVTQKSNSSSYFSLLLLLLFLAIFVFVPQVRILLFSNLVKANQSVIYERTSLILLLWQHILVVVLSTSCSLVFGVILAIFLTRDSGRDLQPLLQPLFSLAQTFPPTAVLALAVPAVGFGFEPLFWALFIYSLFPIIGNGIAGIESVDSSVIESSRAMGMTKISVLLRVELPLAAKMIMAGLRTSFVINIGTATIGAVVGAGGLGVIIISGIINDNLSFILTGSITGALLSLSFDSIFKSIESRFYANRDK